jgi:hypothetical protein
LPTGEARGTHRERERASIGKKERRRRKGGQGGQIVMYKKV